MAFTFTQKLRMNMGDKAYRIYEVTGDASATTIAASDLDLTYIDYAIPHLKDVLTAVAAHTYFTGDATGEYVVLAAAMTASEVAVVEAWGW